jgi:hypothetical protein
MSWSFCAVLFLVIALFGIEICAARHFGAFCALFIVVFNLSGIVRKYVLRGMVVHSGQASGGHYFSYIR